MKIDDMNAKCSLCKQIKPINEFVLSDINLTYCKDCHRIKQREYRIRNREKINAIRKEKYKNNVEFRNKLKENMKKSIEKLKNTREERCDEMIKEYVENIESKEEDIRIDLVFNNKFYNFIKNYLEKHDEYMDAQDFIICLIREKILEDKKLIDMINI